MTFFGKPRWQQAEAHGHDAHAQNDHGHDDHGHGAHALDPHESPNTMMIPLYVLSAGALLAGLLFKNDFIGHEAHEFWRSSLFFGAENHILHEMHEIPEWVGMLPFMMMLGGFLLSAYMYLVSPQTPVRLAQRFQPLYQFLLNKWYFDEL